MWCIEEEILLQSFLLKYPLLDIANGQLDGEHVIEYVRSAAGVSASVTTVWYMTSSLATVLTDFVTVAEIRKKIDINSFYGCCTPITYDDKIQF